MDLPQPPQPPIAGIDMILLDEYHSDPRNGRDRWQYEAPIKTMQLTEGSASAEWLVPCSRALQIGLRLAWYGIAGMILRRPGVDIEIGGSR